MRQLLRRIPFEDLLQIDDSELVVNHTGYEVSASPFGRCWEIIEGRGNVVKFGASDKLDDQPAYLCSSTHLLCQIL